MKITGGATVSDAGVYVAYGDMTIGANGALVSAGDINVLQNGGVNVVQTGVSVISAGVTLSGGLRVMNTGLQVAGGMTVLQQQVSVLNNGGVTVAGSGLVINPYVNAILKTDLGMHVTQGMTISSKGVSIFNNGGISISAGGLVVSRGGATIAQGGLAVTNGLTVTVFGINIPAGGASIYDGLSVTGGMTLFGDAGMFLDSCQLKVAGYGGLTVYNPSPGPAASGIKGGLAVTNSGMTVAGGGLAVAAGGIAVKDTGLAVLGIGGTASITAAGIVYVTGGATVSGSGLYVSGGVTHMNGLSVSGGLSVADVGVLIPDASVFDIKKNGLVVTEDGVLVYSGLAVSTGISVMSLGLNVVTGGLTINAQISRGLVVDSGGLTVSQIGMTVQQHGVIVYDGGVQCVNAGGVALSVTGRTWLESPAIVFSDKRLKTNIEAVINPLSKVRRLRGVYFDWINTNSRDRHADAAAESTTANDNLDTISNSSAETMGTTEKAELQTFMHRETGIVMDDRRHLGMLAQDVAQVFPEAVASMQGGRYLGVNYLELIPLLVEAVRELDVITAAMLQELTAPK
jgi:hypothetical protein